jgi:hypothetical protein
MISCCYRKGFSDEVSPEAILEAAVRKEYRVCEAGSKQPGAPCQFPFATRRRGAPYGQFSKTSRSAACKSVPSLSRAAKEPDGNRLARHIGMIPSYTLFYVKFSILDRRGYIDYAARRA